MVITNERIDDRFTKPPVIIGGCGRSGTSLLLAVLSAHPSIYAIPEETKAFCPSAYTGHIDSTGRFDIDRIRDGLKNANLQPSVTRWCEKTPRNVLFFRRILEEFGEEVRLIHVLRDGRDVITSRHPTRPHEQWVDAERWIRDVSAGSLFDNHPQVLVVRYEDLVLEFKPTIKRICLFLDEAVEPLLDWHRRAKVRQHLAWSDTLQAIHSDSLRRWELPEHARRVARLMADADAVRLLCRYGYLPVNTKPRGGLAPKAVVRRLKRRIPVRARDTIPAPIKRIMRRLWEP